MKKNNETYKAMKKKEEEAARIMTAWHRRDQKEAAARFRRLIGIEREDEDNGNDTEAGNS